LCKKNPESSLIEGCCLFALSLLLKYIWSKTAWALEVEMNTFTQNDLSAGKVRLDYQALLTTARAAFEHCKEALYQEYKHLENIGYSARGLYYTAGRIAHIGEELTIIANTLVTLEGGLDRQKVEIVNKPEIIGE